MTNVEDMGGYVNEITQIKAEIAARDYRALKAYKLGTELESLYQDPMGKTMARVLWDHIDPNYSLPGPFYHHPLYPLFIIIS
ncbi:MAG: hypothetical protein LBQ38_01375 [Spirochaetaceae bacterium]|nr:hypothetical protein [Spirochaetaceae bacterium]